MFVQDTLGRLLFFLFPLFILLFPDGRLTRRWAWVLRSYLFLVVVLMAGLVASEAGTLAGRQIQVDLNGAYSGPGSPTGVLGALAAMAGAGWILTLACPALTDDLRLGEHVRHAGRPRLRENLGRHGW